MSLRAIIIVAALGIGAAGPLRAGDQAHEHHDHSVRQSSSSSAHEHQHAHQPGHRHGHHEHPAEQPGVGESHEHHGHGGTTHGHSAEPLPVEPIPALTDADRAAAFPELRAHPPHGVSVHQFFQFEELETRDATEGTALAWDGRYWAGTDIHRLWLRSHGERVGGRTHSADVEALYGRAVTPWWDLLAGVRHDFHPADSQTFAAIGVQGLAPYFFEIEATAYFGEAGQTAARLEAEYELLLTNRLILQPQIRLDLHGRDDPARGIGSGLSTLEIGMRLRYEITRRFAPYLGVVHERAFGDTADLRRAAGEDTDDVQVVAGVRIWF